MPKKATDGSNRDIAKVEAAVLAGYQKVEKLNESIQANNDKKNAVRSDLVTMGIPKKCFDLAVVMATWDEDEIALFDIAFAVCRKALGNPINPQGDLFEAAERVAANASEGDDDDGDVVHKSADAKDQAAKNGESAAVVHH